MRLIASAIVVAGGLIAASNALTQHFSIGATGNHAAVFRLNNWTGEIALCTAEITQQGNLGPVMRCRRELTDAEAFGSGKDDWIPAPKQPQTDQFGGIRIPESKGKVGSLERRIAPRGRTAGLPAGQSFHRPDDDCALASARCEHWRTADKRKAADGGGPSDRVENPATEQRG